MTLAPLSGPSVLSIQARCVPSPRRIADRHLPTAEGLSGHKTRCRCAGCPACLQNLKGEPLPCCRAFFPALHYGRAMSATRPLPARVSQGAVPARQVSRLKLRERSGRPRASLRSQRQGPSDSRGRFLPLPPGCLGAWGPSHPSTAPASGPKHCAGPQQAPNACANRKTSPSLA